MKPLADSAFTLLTTISAGLWPIATARDFIERVRSSNPMPNIFRMVCDGSRTVLFLLWVGFATCHLRADDLSSSFEQANKLYEQSKYSEAAAAYGKVTKAGKVSAPLYFNLGNALFKSGQIGHAIISYRLAERLAPRDPDIKANLRFARASIHSPTAPSRNRWHDSLDALTLDELTVIAMAAVWIWIVLLTLRQMRKNLADTLKGYTMTAGVVSLFLGIWLGLAAYAHLESRFAVVVVPELVVRYGPLAESQSFYTLRDGAELTVLDRKEIWLQVKDASQRIGWVQSKHVALIPPG